MERADPSIEFSISKSGEFILSTCGEVHLEKCLKDLKDDSFTFDGITKVYGYLLILALFVFERVCLSWLKNRFGCDE